MMDLSQVAAEFSPQGRDALAVMRDFICSSVCLDALNERALLLAGLPQDKIDDGLAEFCRELAEAFEGELSEHLRVAFIVASAEIIRSRIAELQATGSGRA